MLTRKKRKNIKYKRRVRTRKKLTLSSDRPRLSVFRGNKSMYAQIIDITGKSLLGLSTLSKELKSKQKGFNTEFSKEFGLTFGKKLLENKINKVAFDTGAYKYHGKIKAFADGVREAGVDF